MRAYMWMDMYIWLYVCSLVYGTVIMCWVHVRIYGCVISAWICVGVYESVNVCEYVYALVCRCVDTWLRGCAIAGAYVNRGIIWYIYMVTCMYVHMRMSCLYMCMRMVLC